MGSAAGAAKHVCVFGAGRIGVAIARGLLAAGHPADRLLVTTRTGQPTARTGDLPVAANGAAAEVAEFAFICPKPQDAPALLDEIGGFLDPSAVTVSFVSGLTTLWFERRLPDGAAVVRAMTTLAIEARAGTSVLSAGAAATHDQVLELTQLLSALGRSVEAPEDYLNAISAISGGALAYVYFLVEALTHAAVAEGLPNELARELLIEAVVGAGAMMRDSGRHPVQLREDVMSRGGQTIAGFRELERHNVRDALFDAVAAAAARGAALGADAGGSS